jgi:hypothetical protein
MISGAGALPRRIILSASSATDTSSRSEVRTNVGLHYPTLRRAHQANAHTSASTLYVWQVCLTAFHGASSRELHRHKRRGVLSGHCPAQIPRRQPSLRSKRPVSLIRTAALRTPACSFRSVESEAAMSAAHRGSGHRWSRSIERFPSPAVPPAAIRVPVSPRMPP